MIKNKIEKVDFLNGNLLLEFRYGNKLEIKFSQLNKIYIKKIQITQNIAIMFSVVLLVLLFFVLLNEFIDNLYLLISLFLVFIVALKVLENKWYKLVVVSNTGKIFKKRIHKNYKYETVNIINDIKSKMYIWATKSN